MKKLLKLADIRKLNKQVSLGEISSSKMVEIINEMAYEQACKSIESFKIKQAKVLLKLHKETYNKTDFEKQWNLFKEVYLKNSAIESLIFNVKTEQWVVKYNYDVKDDKFSNLEYLINFLNADQFGK